MEQGAHAELARLYSRQFRDYDRDDAGSLLADAPAPEPAADDGDARRDEGELRVV